MNTRQIAVAPVAANQGPTAVANHPASAQAFGRARLDPAGGLRFTRERLGQKFSSRLGDGDWEPLLSSVRGRLAEQRRALSSPVRVVEGELQIHKRMMVPEVPYLVTYRSQRLEVVKRLDGEVVIAKFEVKPQ